MTPDHPAVSLTEENQHGAIDYLVEVQAEATKKHKYNSDETRTQLTQLFKERCGGKEPYRWQLDTAEALILGVDCVVIAGTGAGKTMPFVMPLMQDKSRRMLIISPLKALQQDQVYTAHTR